MEYKIVGNSMQSLALKLDAGEAIYADSGKIISKSSNIKMDPKLAGGIVGAIERKFTGASGFLTEFKANEGTGILNLAGVIPGKIYAIDLKEGEQFIAEHYAFIAAQESVKFSIETVGVGAAFFGGAGLILQRFTGPGMLFIHVAGDIIEYNVTDSDPLEIDPGHIAGFDASLKYKITFVDNIKTAMFGGVGLFLAKFEGNGKVVAHSVSRYKLSTELYLQGKEDTNGGKN
ncbi:MAG: TIGR00266 family protein [Candidatus Marsarchaeota archaeon]|nr:TIGR00266 family protein [Candidatus Marsarchaeota archaeon]MCL5102139.1 TIGR00266 family protein [Candidatus Marsarchaeota archaeon]